MMKVVGNFLIAASLAALFFIYYPIMKFAIGVDGQAKALAGRDRIVIQRIGAVAPLVWDVDPWNEAEYREKLKLGVVQAKNSALPGESGTMFLFAHSSLPPWEMTRTNTAFLFLNQVNNGDRIEIFKDGQEYRYRVSEKKTVWPSEVNQLESGDDLILMTCVPVGTSLKRLLVMADLER